MTYREWAPAPALADCIKCFWTLEGHDVTAEPELICPDGSMEIVFHLADPFERVDGGVIEPQPHTLLAGQLRRAISIRPSGQSRILGVRFRPGGAWPFLHFPQHEVAGRILDLRDAIPAAARLHEQLFETSSWPDAIRSTEQFLMARRRGDLSVLSRSFSERQRRRQFLNIVGVTPKFFERVARFRRARAVLGRSDLASMAHECGYADQSHLTRDFREFSGHTPAELLRRMHLLDDHFVSGG